MESIKELQQAGFLIFNDVYSLTEINKLIEIIDKQSISKSHLLSKGRDFYAIRQVVKEIPEILNIILNDSLKSILDSVFDFQYFIVKSIYFDKPEKSNWFVLPHQDLTLSVKNKKEEMGFTNWLPKFQQFSVQPRVEFLESITTIRIHLDDTDENNGALKVTPKSHLNGILTKEETSFKEDVPVFCPVRAGGIMLMKPLLIHGSDRTKNNSRRRVLHIEFSNQELPDGLEWGERINCN